ncbi:MAG: excinuclease ABC subunit UvrC [Eubacteriales bacterium]|nr:excinuclease ABC subunit UvrC [Eubacteriales bacterium]MDD3199840.1 excinuclease ABC subunit UvrC [Eubacteriales bacterium]MDD4122263.1 excinuclease ABC subunit UvrC [Eubacteriales bacterium]MDD4630128.1 excinuclease ABC subunit UvrC [Eubacteriales bacterium]
MFDIKENLKKLPDKPGVYLHKDKLGQVIYVGKAVSLKNRVRQYFQSSKNMDAKVRAMVSHIEEFEYITTNTEMEALILENNLIKKYMPQYNVLLRDDKTYPYIKISTNESYPRILKTRRILHDGCKYFGPYTDVTAVNQMIDMLNSIFALKRCSSLKFPADFKPCLNYHINQCRGICTGQISKEEYQDAINHAIELLNGKDKKILTYLSRKMTEEAESMNFEKAAEYRDHIAAVNAITEKQRVVLPTAGDMDVVLGIKGKSNAHVILFFVRQGKLSGRESYHLQAMEEDDLKEIIYAFIKQYYSDQTMIPKEILLESELEDTTLLKDWLSEIRGNRVRITVPQKGAKKALLDMAKQDVFEMMKTLDEKAEIKREKEEAVSSALKVLIGESPADKRTLENPVLFQNGWRVEAYDISNTNGVDSVGAMVVFKGSRPLRKEYRRFKIRTIEGPNDFGSLQEILYRRFKRGIKGDQRFSDMPDLILVDGGKPQVTAAEQVLRAMKIDIPVAGMVKNDKHKTRGLIFRDQELELKDNPVLYRYIASIQEEVHRFAIDYHRNLRKQSLQKSALDAIEGIGEKRRNALLSHFGSIDRIKEATPEELYQVPGITRPVAGKIIEWASKSH